VEWLDHIAEPNNMVLIKYLMKGGILMPKVPKNMTGDGNLVHPDVKECLNAAVADLATLRAEIIALKGEEGTETPELTLEKSEDS